VIGLAEEGAEVESLTDGRGLEMKVLLLHVASLALEGCISGTTINKHFAGDNTHGSSISEAVKKSGLAGT